MQNLFKSPSGASATTNIHKLIFPTALKYENNTVFMIFRETHGVKRINLAKVIEERLWQNCDLTVHHFFHRSPSYFLRHKNYWNTDS